MSNQVLALPKGFGAPSKVFANQPVDNSELGQGVAASYGVIGYRGKVWSTKYQGKEIPLMRDDGDGPRGSIEVVLIKTSPAISKIFYANGYQDGSNQAPDCWSADGIKPDGSVAKKVSPTCANCPMNAWGSRVTEAGKPGKACSDSRRLAVVPVNDIANESFGGPMLLRVPAASLNNLKAYGSLLDGYGYHSYAVATRVSFDPAEAFPKLVFNAIRPLSDEEAVQIVELRDDKRVSTVVSEMAHEFKEAAAAPEEEVPSSPFELPPQTTSQKAQSARGIAPTAQAVAKASAPAQAKAAATKAPVKAPPPEETTSEDEEAGGTMSEDSATKSFDALLDNLIS